MRQHVTLNLSGAALEQFRRWTVKRRGSEMVQALILQWIARSSDMALLRPGDRRTSITGDELTWTGDRWEEVE